jgi:hypothetical protein
VKRRNEALCRSFGRLSDVLVDEGPSALLWLQLRTHNGLMPWFFRAIETVEGRWECRHGAQLFDDHATLDAALRHLRLLTAEQPAVQVFVHTRDGQVRNETIA